MGMIIFTAPKCFSGFPTALAPCRKDTSASLKGYSENVAGDFPQR